MANLFEEIAQEADELYVESVRLMRSESMAPVDQAELLRMIQECRRFLTIPMPEEKLPF